MMTSRVLFSIGDSSSDSEVDARDVIDSNAQFYVETQVDLGNVGACFENITKPNCDVKKERSDSIQFPSTISGQRREALFGHTGNDVTRSSFSPYLAQRRRSRSKSPEMMRLVEKVRERRRTSAPELLATSYLMTSCLPSCWDRDAVKRKLSVTSAFRVPPAIDGTLFEFA